MSPAGKPTSKHPDSASRYSFWILVAAGCLTTMTGGVVAPVLPEMVLQLDLDPNWAGYVVSIHAITSALATPVMGVLSDRLGKLKVMLPCLVLYTLFGVSTAFMTSFALLLTTRALLGIASGGVAAAAIGFLGSMYDGEQRSRILGYATSTMTTSAVFFPILGGWVGGSHWQYAFYLYGLGLPLAVLAVRYLEERRDRADSLLDVSQPAKLGKVVRQFDVFKLYLFIGAAALIVNAVVIYTPLYLKAAIDATPALNGFVLAVRLVGAAVVSAVGASQLAKRFGESKAIAFGFSLMAFTLVTIPFLTELYLIVPTAVLFGVGFGILTPNLYNVLAGVAPSDLRASVLAIGTGFNSLGQFAAPVVLGPIWKFAGLPTVFYAAAGMAAVASMLSLVQSKPTQA